MTFHDLATSFGITPQLSTHELYNYGSYTSGGVIRTLKTTKELIKRVSSIKLEEVYYKDPITFNTINKGVQMISASGDRIEYKSIREKVKFEEFLDNLAKVGEDYSWGELKNYILWSQMVFGAAWIELIWNEDDDMIVDLSKLDPKVMDYAKNSYGDILLDDNQKPIGYVQKLPWGINAKGKGDIIPEKYEKFIDLGSDKIFLLPKRISLIKLFTFADGLNFIGLIEPAYVSITRKLMLEEAGTNSAYQRWMAPLIANIGDDKHPPTPQLAKTTLETMTKMKHDLYSVYPYYVKLDTLNSNSPEALNDILKYLKQNQSSASGMPISISAGMGESVNRSTLNIQQNVMQFTLNDIAQRTSENITKYIFKPVAESMKLKGVPKLIPNRVNIDEVEDVSLRINQYVKNGILSSEQALTIVKHIEGWDIPDDKKEDNKNNSNNKNNEEKNDKLENKTNEIDDKLNDKLDKNDKEKLNKKDNKK